jgi:hypothetical protein
LISQVFISPLAGNSALLSQILYFYTYLVLLSAVTAIIESNTKLISFIALYVTSFVSSVLFFKTNSLRWLATSEASDMLMLAITIWGIMTFMRKQKRVTRDLISGAICVYMLMGAIWANGYSICEIYHRGSFSGLDLAASVFDIRNALTYFSYITMMTIGYGDMLPVTPMARSLVMLQGLLGQKYLAVFVAGTIGMFLSHKDRTFAEETKAVIRKAEPEEKKNRNKL